MGLFNKENFNQKQAKVELEKYIIKRGSRLWGTPELLNILKSYPQYHPAHNDEIFFPIYSEITKSIKKGKISYDEVDSKVQELIKIKCESLTAPSEKQMKKYDKKVKQSEKAKYKLEEIKNEELEKEEKLTQKYGVDFSQYNWFECTIEEVKAGTITNNPRRQLDKAYVIIEEDYLHIFKESIVLKSKMGVKKVFFKNVANFDYDSRGRFHLSNSLVINLKSSDSIILKSIPKKYVDLIQEAFDNFMNNNPDEKVVKCGADELLKWHNLYEEGVISEEEFEAKKKELL